LGGLSVVLLIAVIWQGLLLKGQREELAAMREQGGWFTASSSTGIDSQNPSRPTLAVEVEQPEPPAATTREAAAPAEFNWRKLESADYRSYISNLRAVGCPEATVRDIVVADVVETFAPHRAEVVANRYRDFQFWKTDLADSVARAELERQQREMDAWMGEVVRELLGDDTTTPATGTAWDRAVMEEQLSYLAPDIRAEVVNLLMDYRDVDSKIEQLSSNRLRLEDTEERLRVIADYDREREALRALLTPEEYELMDMTVSWTAENLRRAMVRFEPTEEEFRQIFRVWRDQDEGLAVIFANREPDPGKEHVFASIAGFLSPERYAQYRSTWWK